MREVELKSVVPDPALARQRMEQAGARLVFSGKLADRRYDTADRQLAQRDHVLRLRIYRAEGNDAAGTRASLEFKGPTAYIGGYKVREELSASSGDAGVLADILARLGYVVTREIDRDIRQYALPDVTVRFEHYPRLDALVEVEGTPEGIERAIAVLDLPRDGFTTDRLPAFIARFESRTGQRAAVSDRELAGQYDFRTDDA
jgi:adenylate cyclase class IV